MPSNVQIEIQLTGEAIEARTLQDTFADLIKMLRDVELHVRNRKRSRLHWYVTEADPEIRLQASPNGVPREQIFHVAKEIHSAFERIVDADGRKIDWPETFGTKAKSAATRIVRRLDKRVSMISLRVDEFPPLEINNVALRNEYGLPATYVEFASIDGILDLISVRGRNVFSVSDKISGRHVRCTLAGDIFEKAKDCLRRRVVVEGFVRYDKDGLPSQMTNVKSLLLVPEPNVEWDELIGSRPRFSGGLSSGEYIRRERASEDDAD